MRWLFTLIFLLFAGLVQAGNDPFAVKKNEFLPVGQAFAFSSEKLESGQTRLYWQIADNYYLYQKRLKFEGLDPAQRPVLPQAQSHSDEFFGEQPIYRNELELLIPAGASGQVTVGWQGCADAGLCYPPQSQVLDLGGAAAQPVVGQAQDQSLANRLSEHALGWSLLVFFGLGLLLAFTPCTLPMLPILAGLVVGSGASPRRGFALAGSYVVSMALVYAALGVIAALLGGNLQAFLQQPWLLGSFAALFVVLALPMFGFFELQLPAALRDRLERAGQGRQGGSLVGAGIIGALSGLLVGPCMTAPLAGALLYIAQSGNLLFGGLVLFSLGIGMGLPLLLLVTVGNRFLPKPGAWMDRVKAIFGFLFLGTAILMVRPVLDESLWVGLWGALALIVACCAWRLSHQPGRAALIARCSCLLLGLWGTLLVIGAAGGGSDPWRPLQVYTGSTAGGSTGASHDAFVTVNDPAALQRELDSAKAQGQWVLVDYYADWCVSCKIMEKQVFAKAEVIDALRDVRLVRLDVTADTGASRELLGRFEVPGPPTLLWITPEGVEQRSSRITGEVDVSAFLQNWHNTRDAR
ncbi:thiol:disulfide interchange protein [Pseudomonas agarici]|uniref:Thiol:disulfide interchange protein DsbD n=1 Tax=Pseudomonas agarici TaxID=46677 RepID=A0A0X1T0Z0_PSEAA|nr:protein-disulfide reductase DsbD [Pseudomonas agarici]AMB85735.1 thiol:disulfide interchange protein [Pseudomonas agarici]NWB90976.1 protein-disulfide reductase DsbD [Pseudomonas agarici]NWC09659.1 protein-disulfide reductase DsbD [Pseudomonas agarici]SEL20772.1 Thiol:disulfide interchange protein DsbD [Pseudomonas agarici]